MDKHEQKNLLQDELQVSDELSLEDLEQVSGGHKDGIVGAAGELAGEIASAPIKNIFRFGRGFVNGVRD